MEPISNVIKNIKHTNNDNNVISNNISNYNNVPSKNEKYALNSDSFTPNTEESQLAEQIATSFNDLQNYAFYLHVVKKLGFPVSHSFWKCVELEIKEKKDSRYEIRSPKKYFAWKFKEKLYS